MWNIQNMEPRRLAFISMVFKLFHGHSIELCSKNRIESKEEKKTDRKSQEAFKGRGS